MVEAPTGTVTFLFTDIEGSTRRWERDPDAAGRALAGHDAILAEVIETGGGHVFKRLGDAFCAAFSVAADALDVALDAQRRLTSGSEESLPVRMALHTGVAEQRDDDYFGAVVNRVARLVDAGHGGQVLLSGTTRNLVVDDLPDGAVLRDLGEHRFKDLQRATRVHQLVHPDLPADFPPLRSLDARRHNLPVHLTAFIGREREMEEIGARLTRDRLVTLSGPGGSGKTRLATQVAAEAVDAYPDGVWLVELAPLADAELVPQSVATALGVREEPDRDLSETIADALEGRRTLLLLDNCEHVIEAAAELADGLLRRSTDLVILATSREPLDVPGEIVWPVPPLAVPEAWSASGAEGVRLLEPNEAVRLFLDRARSNRPGFELTERNAGAVAEICRRLDGIPLAIELAAVRIRALPAEEIADRLDDRFALLTSGGRTTLPRHRTLRATVDWSYGLLDESERVLFRRLAVFAGGWTLAAAEAVAPDPAVAGDRLEPGDVLDVLARLVDKSLVVMEETDAGPWYRFPETLRAYARERLVEEDKVDAVPRRHRDWYLELGREAEEGLETAERADWMARLERERDNLRAALEWSMEDERDVEGGLRLATAIRMFWYRRGSVSEHMAWLERGLSAASEPEPRTKIAAMTALGMAAAMINQADRANRWGTESLELAREDGDREGTMRALLILAHVVYHRADYQESTELYEEALSIALELGDERSAMVVLNNLGEIARITGDLERARSLYQRILDEHYVVADPEVLHFNLGQVAIERGDFEGARGHLRECLRISLETTPGYVPIGLLGIAQVLAETGCHERAALLFGASEAAREKIGMVIHDADLRPIEHSIEVTRQAMKEAAFREAWERGRAMPEREAVETALAVPINGRLSKRETTG